MALAIAAIVILAALGVVGLVARPSSTPVASASPSTGASVVATATATASVTPSATFATSAAAPPKPDAKHGLVTFTNIRTEDDPRDLQQPAQFSRTANAVPFTAGIGVSPDGKAVAMIRTGQTGQQLIAFTTSKPNDVAILIDFAGSGESAGGLVWAGDGAASLLLAVHKSPPPGQSAYSTLRVVDVATKQVREIARITSGSFFMPIAWRPDRSIGAAVEIAAGAASAYDLVRGGGPAIERTQLGGAGGPITASRDGLRVAAVITPAPEVGPTVSWWPMDQPSARKDIVILNSSRVEFAAFRPGAPDELGVRAQAPSVGGPVPAHFELWNVATGAQRAVSTTIGFEFWRVDGSAAIAGTTLIDPSTGATTPLPGGAFKVAEVVLF